MVSPYQKSDSPHAPLGNEFALILGANVERLRKRRHLTKTRFSAMAGIGRPTLDRIEKGIHDPRLSLLTKLAEILEVDMRDLLTAPSSEFK